MHLTNFDLDNYLKELETIVNMDSGSSYPEGVAKVADFFIKKYKELGCYTDKVNLSPRIGPLSFESIVVNVHDDLKILRSDFFQGFLSASCRHFHRIYVIFHDM
jgi:hypothetical protein